MPLGKPSSVKPQALHDFLLETRANMADYHARKENMAWVATTVYLGAVLAITNIGINNDHLLAPTALFRFGLIALILLTAGFTWMFLRKQYGDRFTAALIIGACGDILGQLIDPSFKISAHSLGVQEWHHLDHTFIFPNILIERLNWRADHANWLPQHFFASYAVMALWTIAACIILAYFI